MKIRRRTTKRLNRYWERIDPEVGSITTYEALRDRNIRRELIMPKHIAMLSFMVDGKYEPVARETYGGNGSVRLNSIGGWAFDSHVRKLIDRGHVVISRPKGHTSKFGGTNTVNTTVATITDEGRLAYAVWKKRMKGRL
ncbi:hypothetical protein D3C71_1466710 [compost metagenome]